MKTLDNLRQKENRLLSIKEELEAKSGKSIVFFQTQLQSKIEENTQLQQTDKNLPSEEFMNSQIEILQKFTESMPETNDLAGVVELLNKHRVFRKKCKEDDIRLKIRNLLTKYERIHPKYIEDPMFPIDYISNSQTLRKRIRILFNSMKVADQTYPNDVSKLKFDITVRENALQNRIMKINPIE